MYWSLCTSDLIILFIGCKCCCLVLVDRTGFVAVECLSPQPVSILLPKTEIMQTLPPVPQPEPQPDLDLAWQMTDEASRLKERRFRGGVMSPSHVEVLLKHLVWVTLFRQAFSLSFKCRTLVSNL